MPLAQTKLDDKYTQETGRVYLTGIQALVRLPLMQRARDLAAEHNTAGFISGYRGSPLGGLDKALWQAADHLEKSHIHFQPGLNEDLAATSIWGSQQVNLYEGADYDGVFGMWYGKGPGVDRCGDIFRHANAAGTSPLGGVLVIAGDDHTAKSSTLPHQTEYAFVDAMMPILNPAGVQEILDLGLTGWALSRYCGCWVTLKTIAETVDTSASVYIDPERIDLQQPDSHPLPGGGLNIRWPHKPLEQEMLQHRHRLYAALAFARANRLNRIVIDSPQPRLGIVSCGKSYLDTLQALEDLGLDATRCADIGIRVCKIAMSWPLERDGVREFASGLQQVLVVEEKRGLIENQIKEQLYNWSEAVRPVVVGKFDEHGEWLLPSHGELTPARIARVIADRIKGFHNSEIIRSRLRFLQQKATEMAHSSTLLERTPHFCSGCPHNTSTKVPEGSRATAGIGCHYMATWMGRSTSTYTHMGGEGVPWIGQAPFTGNRHIFANLGDGTYFHSGVLAIRAAIAAGVNITYKILYNDAVAMTGGQPVDGPFSVERLVRQLEAEGVESISLVSDHPEKFEQIFSSDPSLTIHHRKALDSVQRTLRRQPGVTVLIYEQMCAAEKRRRRKRGLLEDPPLRPFINSAVCENCGDCSRQSNCLSVVPVETELGRKRAIDQSSCNKDYRCLDAFCPAFVSVEGAQRRHTLDTGRMNGVPDLSRPPLPECQPTYNILLTGIGGTGVVTTGALLGMAAHLEGKGVTVLDMTGLAQKYGAVVSHIRIAASPEEIHAMRIPAGEADALLACDMVVASNSETLAKLDRRRCRAVINSHKSMTAAFLDNQDLSFPAAEMASRLKQNTREQAFVDATRIAAALFGNSLGANLLLLGYAWQKGLIPLSLEALERAVELNGIAVEQNLAALAWGRTAAEHPEMVMQRLNPQQQSEAPKGLTAIVAHRASLLTAYQNRSYALRYQKLVRRVELRERDLKRSGLAEVVANGYARLLAYKDEYEVARLHCLPEFHQQLAESFADGYRLSFTLALPFTRSKDPDTGRPRRHRFGRWMLPLFQLLRRMKWLRQTRWDPFGLSADRRLERALIAEYESVLEQLLSKLDESNFEQAIGIVSIVDRIRGFGPIKQAAAEQVRREQQRLLKTYLKRPASHREAA